MRAPSGIVLNPLDIVFSLREAMKIHDPDAAFVAASAMANGDLARSVAAAAWLALLGKGEVEDGPAFEEVVIYGADEMTNARGTGGVAAESGLTGEGFVAEGGWFGG
jgi:hypothetical protein